MTLYTIVPNATVHFHLPELLETYTISKTQADKYQIVFECIDGYKPMMPLQKFLSVKSFLAVRDMDAKGELWSKIIKDGNRKQLLYLVYQGFLQKTLILNGRTT
jgi:hypothetical protein